MRTTIRLNDRLLSEAKKAARESSRTLTAVVEDALRQALAQRRPKVKRPRVKLCTVKGSGLLPGVDLDDSAALLETLEN